MEMMFKEKLEIIQLKDRRVLKNKMNFIQDCSMMQSKEIRLDHLYIKKPLNQKKINFMSNLI